MSSSSSNCRYVIDIKQEKKMNELFTWELIFERFTPKIDRSESFLLDMWAFIFRMNRNWGEKMGIWKYQNKTPLRDWGNTTIVQMNEYPCTCVMFVRTEIILFLKIRWYRCYVNTKRCVLKFIWQLCKYIFAISKRSFCLVEVWNREKQKKYICLRGEFFILSYFMHTSFSTLCSCLGIFLS